MTPEVEIALHRRDEASYAAELRLRTEDDDRHAEEYPVRFESARLAELANDPKAYGEVLTRNLFVGKLRDLWITVRGQAAPEDAPAQPLRLRLWIDHWSFPLHRLRWETLRDPVSGRSLVTDMKVWFSRHLSSAEKRPVRLRLKRARLRVLAAAASPPDLKQWRDSLAPIDVATVLRQARKTVGPVDQFTELPQATLTGLTEQLRDDKNEFDLLYLVCHGAIDDRGEPFLLLVDKDGTKAEAVPGDALVELLTGLRQVPRLIVLESCQSAGQGHVARGREDASLVALGPRLAEAGVPAVIAMHGNVTQDTADRFTDVFFKVLFADDSDGQIDRAVTEARSAIQDQADAWAPVLYLRAVEGRLWNLGQFTSHDQEFQGWATVLDHLRRKKCVPVLGSGLLDHVVGTPQELARRWAESSQYPLARQDFTDLTRVAQFLETRQGGGLLRENYVEELIKGAKRLWPPLAQEPPMQADEEPEQYLLRLFSRAWPLLKERYPNEPHRVLARLDCPLYITTNPDNLLPLALAEAKVKEKVGDQVVEVSKKPREKLCPWRQGGQPAQTANADLGPFSEKEPLIYQMFGSLNYLPSLVLTEEDYLNYLMGVASLHSQEGGGAGARPQLFGLASILVRRGLLFLGFRLEDWDFRLFHRFLMSRPAWQNREEWKPVDVAVQLNPDDTNVDPAAARHFLAKRFQSYRITIYWGSVENFMQELNERLD
jgi:hypothetical protein